MIHSRNAGVAADEARLTSLPFIAAGPPAPEMPPAGVAFLVAWLWFTLLVCGILVVLGVIAFFRVGALAVFFGVLPYLLGAAAVLAIVLAIDAARRSIELAIAAIPAATADALRRTAKVGSNGMDH